MHSDRAAFPRACKECAMNRVRCPRGDPCQRCADRAVPCVYPTSRKRKAPSGDGHANMQTGAAVSSVPAEAAANQPAWMIGWPPGSHGFANGNMSTMPDAADPAGLNMEMGLGGQLSDAFAVNWLSPSDMPQYDWTSHMASLEAGNAEGCHTMSPPFFSEYSSLGNNWNWPARAKQPESQAARLLPAARHASSTGRGSPFDPRRAGRYGSTPSESQSSLHSPVATLYVEGGGSRAPFKGLSKIRRSLPSVLGAMSNGSPGVSPGGASTSDSAAAGVEVLSVQTYERMVEKANPATSFRPFPAHHQMESFFRLYFQHFHPSFPFLRPQSTFYEPPSQWLVTLALCTVGARYCCKPESLRAGPLLSDILQDALSQAVGDAGFEMILAPWAHDVIPEYQDEPSVLATVQALMLNLICKTHGDRDRSHNGVLMDRYKLVQACRSMRLLVSRSPDPQEQEVVSDPEHATAVWLSEQSRMRTGYTIWVSFVRRHSHFTEADQITCSYSSRYSRTNSGRSRC
jgi:hypothetical protein